MNTFENSQSSRISHNLLVSSFFLALLAIGYIGSLIFVGTFISIPLMAAVLAATCAIFYFQSKLFCIFLLLASLIFKNLVIAFYSPFISNKQTFSQLQGLDFGILAVLGAMSIIFLFKNIKQYDRNIQLAIKGSLLFLAAAFIYFTYGMTKNSFTGVLIYFRNFSNPIFFFAFGLIAARYISKSSLQTFLFVFSLFLIAYGFIELFLPIILYESISLVHFLDLKRDSVSILYPEQIKQLLTRRWFNTPLLDEYGIQARRLLGPNLHHVSYSYLVAFAVCVLIGMRKYIFVFMGLIILLNINSKGPVILCFFVFSAMLISRFGISDKLGLFIYTKLLIAYACLALIVGYSIKDYHVLGFIGGINGFIGNPIGYGFGSGGNLATENLNWQDYQKLGATSFGVESSVGVLLYQWGIFGAAFYGFLIFLWWKLAKDDFSTKSPLFPIMAGKGVVLANMIFQEEAIGPSAAGIWMFVIGYMIAKKEPKNINLLKSNKLVL